MAENENYETLKKEADDKQSNVHEENINKYRKVISGLLAGLSVIVVLILKANNPDMQIWKIIVTELVVIGVCVLVFFWYELQQKFKKQEHEMKKGLPAPASIGELRALARNAMTNEDYANHTTGCIEDHFEHAGRIQKEAIYYYKTRAVYKDYNMKRGEVVILINAHYPEMRTTLIDPNEAEIRRAINGLATNPEEEIRTIKETSYNPILGTYHEKEAPEKKEEKKEPKEDETEDFK